MRVALGVAYNGAHYHGWQVQLQVSTVQAQLERAIEAFVLAPHQVTCAGRTDTGVHAHQQVVHLDTEVLRDEFSWVRGVNAFLPADIRVQWARHMTGDLSNFHARKLAVRRRYRYVLTQAAVASATMHPLQGWVFLPLDDELMRLAAKAWLGEQDFSAFRAAECQALSPNKTLHRLDIERVGDYRVFCFEANAFLHHMVRNMMGTLIAIGTGKRPLSWAQELLAAKDRRKGDPTFMPNGLYLDGVKYPEVYGLDGLTWATRPYLV
jgi:tRNA pseudouridine38-40 synthase